MTIARLDYFDEVIGAITETVQLDHFTQWPKRSCSTPRYGYTRDY